MKTIGHHSIVVGIDESASGKAALDWAIEEATRRRHPLHLVRGREREVPLGSGVGYWPAIPEPQVEPAGESSKEVLARSAAHARSASPSLTVTVEVSPLPAAAALVELSKRADTVVLGSHGDGAVLAALLGSVSTQVSLHARCPVVIVRERPDGWPTPSGVVVGVDGSAVSGLALGYAFEEASSRGCRLDVVHAWWTRAVAVLSPELREDQATQQRLTVSESMAGWAEKYPDVEVHQHLPIGPVVMALVEQASAAELLVVGSRGRGGFRRLLLGSVSHGVLQHARCPVAVVRQTTAQASAR